MSLTGPGVTNVYTIEILLSLTTDCNNKFCKLVDFKNLASDDGMYTAPDNSLNLYNIAIGSAAVGNGLVNVTITRDASGTFNAYLNGAQQFSVNDTTGIGTVSDNILWFLHDDGQQGNPGEHPKGFVDSIRIFNTVDSQAPEPAGLILTAAGLVALCALKLRRRS